MSFTADEPSNEALSAGKQARDPTFLFLLVEKL
jgi:hypothetical protein